MNIDYILTTIGHFKPSPETRVVTRNHHWRRFYELLNSPHQKAKAMQHKDRALSIENTLDKIEPNWRALYLKPKKIKNPASR